MDVSCKVYVLVFKYISTFPEIASDNFFFTKPLFFPHIPKEHIFLTTFIMTSFSYLHLVKSRGTLDLVFPFQ